MKVYYNLSQYKADVLKLAKVLNRGQYLNIYGVPQGGTILATDLAHILQLPMIENNISEKTLIVDDVIDSGKTREQFPRNDFICLHVKKHAKIIEYDNVMTLGKYSNIEDWIIYWWEGSQDKSIEDSVIRQLEYIGENPNREGLLETPKRVVKAWEFLFSGYKQDFNDIIKIFDSDGCDEIVLLKDIEIYSTCEHHLMPFFGKCHIAYIPDKKVIGISKLARLADIFSRRLQIQERIGEQITNCLMINLQPKGAACIIEAKHLCMMARGIQKQNSVMITSSLKGAFLEKLSARNELMRLIG